MTGTIAAGEIREYETFRESYAHIYPFDDDFYRVSPCVRRPMTAGGSGEVDRMVTWTVAPGVTPAQAPDYSSAIEPALLNLAPNTARAYATGMRQYLAWLAGRQMTARATKEWADALRAEHSTATVNLRLAAVRRLAEYACECGMLDDATAGRIARVKGLARRGVRMGNWLTVEQAQAIFDALDRSTLIGKRDAVIYALLFGCGLRVGEAARVTVGHMTQREGRWVLANLEGKHNRVRTVPVSPWAAEVLKDWLETSNATTGRLVRVIGQSGAVGGQLSVQGVYRRVVAMGKAVGVKIASHDFRRTFGALAKAAGGDEEQLQHVYGHADRRTTRDYLNLHLDLAKAPGDAIKIRV